MKHLLFAAFLLVLNYNSTFAQTEVELEDIRFSENWFEDLEEASKSPDKVFYIDLSLLKLKEFPKVILTFKNLKQAHFAVNYWPSIPNEIGSLKQLEKLDLSSNYYLNTLPEGLKELTNLKELNLRDNKLNKGEVEKAREWLPNCTILVD